MAQASRSQEEPLPGQPQRDAMDGSTMQPLETEPADAEVLARLQAAGREERYGVKRFARETYPSVVNWSLALGLMFLGVEADVVDVSVLSLF